MVAFGDVKRCPTVPAIGPGTTYDANGNRTGSGYTVGSGNRMLSDGTYDYTYDNEGNTTRRTCIADGSVTDYTWDYRNRLTEVTDRASLNGAPTQIVDYIYDVNNHLIEEITDPDGAGSEPATAQWFVYDPLSPLPSGEGQGEGQMVLRYTGTPGVGAALADYYVWGPATDFLLCDEHKVSPSEIDIDWTLGDNLNTIRDIAQYNSTTHTTTVIDHIAYSAFGVVTTETAPSTDCLFKFTGRPLDTATGFQNNWNRVFYAAAGRFPSPDPSGLGPDVNPYHYCGNGLTYRG